MRRDQLQHLDLWNGAKYISWPHSRQHPLVRVPRPEGPAENCTIHYSGDEQETFQRCLDYRNKRGIEIWGEGRWKQILTVKARGVAKPIKGNRNPYNGVSHLEAKGRRKSNCWIASWYAIDESGERRPRSKTYSYGDLPSAQYSTSAEARKAALEKREEMERLWYSVYGVGNKRQVNRLP